MSEHGSRSPDAEIQEQYEIVRSPEYTQACKNTKLSGDLVSELLKLGVSRTEVKTFALSLLEKNIRAGYGLEVMRSIAKQGGAIAEIEVDELFEKIKAKMLMETPTEIEEQKAQREDKELAEMLKLYE